MASGSQDHLDIDLSSEGKSRILGLAQRALRAESASLLAPDDFSASPAGSTNLEAPVAFEGMVVARLVVRGEAGRLWSDEDDTMVRDLAAILAEEIRLTRLVARLEAGDAISLSVPADQTLPEATATEQRAGAIRILLADDLDLNRKLICDMLSLDGYVVDSVADGAAAVEAAKATAYDLILMDMIMPGMDGLDATRAIRALPAPACDVPIVALTAHSFREQLDNCLNSGMNATLTKPMSFDTLTDAVSTWARTRREAA